MKRWSLLIVVLALSALAHSQPVQAQTQVVHFKSQSAYAIFSTTDGCVATDVIISASQGYNHAPPGPKPALSSAFLTVFQSNVCTGETLIDIAGDAPLAVNAFTANQHSAHLRAPIDVYERVSDSFFDVFVDLAWTSTGPLIRHRERTHDLANCVVNSYIVGSASLAQATGSILVQGTNITPTPSIDAMVFMAHEGMVGIDCPEPG